MNVKLRKDSWTLEDDNLLKEIILNKIEQGQTQISGFEEASILLGRSKQACAFRWNKNLRPTLFKRESTKKEVSLSTQETTDSPTIENHLQLAMKSYDEMKQTYEKITLEYNLLKKDYEQIVNWVKQGKTYV
ncbi:transcriptional regulator [Psychrobacillus sp. MER TA 171]|uniref:transcriptional regulator n=1 Tax=Psychrobacillus sp. MER TA 171 TaxID=2939577 RepID=UPI00203FDA4D|nr:transcriptional regulator [Psychrobacillus sp. MER TA 171]MCM3358118.1 transcriptional regulator [Psychrobacillus sp. MER TA 171]